MNTNQELQEALYELCQATVKVMRIAYNGTIPAELVSASVRTTLQHLVNITDNVGIPNQPAINESTVANVHEHNMVPTQPVVAEPVENTKQIQEVVYGYNPINREGVYMWPRLSPDADEQRYKVTKYTDGTADFELIKLSGEDLHFVWMSKSDSIPSSVVSVNGNGAPTDGSSLVTIVPGKGKVKGRTVIVESPCITEIKN